MAELAASALVHFYTSKHNTHHIFHGVDRSGTIVYEKEHNRELTESHISGLLGLPQFSYQLHHHQQMKWKAQLHVKKYAISLHFIPITLHIKRVHRMHIVARTGINHNLQLEQKRTYGSHFASPCSRFKMAAPRFISQREIEAARKEKKQRTIKERERILNVWFVLDRFFF